MKKSVNFLLTLADFRPFSKNPLIFFLLQFVDYGRSNIKLLCISFAKIIKIFGKITKKQFCNRVKIISLGAVIECEFATVAEGLDLRWG